MRLTRIILITFLSLLLIGGLMYFFFFRPTPQLPATNTAPVTETPDSNLTANSRITKLSSQEIFDYWITPGGEIYYLTLSGQVIRLRQNTEEIIVPQSITESHIVLPSPDGSAILVEFNYPQQPTWAILTLNNAIWEPLPAFTAAAAWSPDGQQIAFLDNDVKGGGLKLLNRSTNKTSVLVSLSQPDATLHWVTPNEILIVLGSPSAIHASSVWRFNIQSKTLIPLSRGETGFVFQWSPLAKFGLVFSTAQQTPQFLLTNESFDTLLRFPFITFPEKCSLGSTTMVCAVPAALPEGSQLPDDYYTRTIATEDMFYLFDFTKGSNALLLDQPGIDAIHLTQYQNNLFFLNQYDHQLYKFSLTP